MFGRAYEIPTRALRFFNVFGSRQSLDNPYTGIAAIFTGRLRSGKAPLIFEDGRQTRDFIHVSDVADAVIAAVDSDVADALALNVCTGRAMSVHDVAHAIAHALGVNIAPEIAGRYRAGDVRHCVGDPAMAERAILFKAKMAFESGLRELLTWSAQHERMDVIDRSVAELEQHGLLR